MTEYKITEEYPIISKLELISFCMMLLMYVISPLASIWALNTLFSTSIPISFKTWLAGLILLIVIRFVTRSKTVYPPASPYDDDEWDDEFDDDDWPDDDEVPFGPKGKLIVHPGRKDTPPEKE